MDVVDEEKSVLTTTVRAGVILETRDSEGVQFPRYGDAVGIP